MAIYVVRHGECEGNVAGLYVAQIESPLTERGRQQAHEAASVVKELGISRIVSSPLSRARDTAQIIADELGLPVHVDSRIIEYDMGSLAGMTKDNSQLEAQLDMMTGEEVPLVCARRITDCIAEYAAQPGNTLFVSHAGVMRMVNALQEGKAPEEFYFAPTLDNAAVAELDIPRLLAARATLRN